MEALAILVVVVAVALAACITRAHRSLPMDPVRHCQFHRDMGCAHVDGPHCDMNECGELDDYRRFLE